MQPMKKTYEPSKSLMSFHIRGFQHWDGALVLNQLQAGSELDLVAEPDNPYDSQAVALYFDQTKLGYIPAEENGLLATMIFFGHVDAFTVRVLQVDEEANPWQQVRVGIFVTDARRDDVI